MDQCRIFTSLVEEGVYKFILQERCLGLQKLYRYAAVHLPVVIYLPSTLNLLTNFLVSSTQVCIVDPYDLKSDLVAMATP